LIAVLSRWVLNRLEEGPRSSSVVPAVTARKPESSATYSICCLSPSPPEDSRQSQGRIEACSTLRRISILTYLAPNALLFCITYNDGDVIEGGGRGGGAHPVPLRHLLRRVQPDGPRPDGAAVRAHVRVPQVHPAAQPVHGVPGAAVPLCAVVGLCRSHQQQPNDISRRSWISISRRRAVLAPPASSSSSSSNAATGHGEDPAVDSQERRPHFAHGGGPTAGFGIQAAGAEEGRRRRR
jgi:hypothetical protein